MDGLFDGGKRDFRRATEHTVERAAGHTDEHIVEGIVSVLRGP